MFCVGHMEKQRIRNPELAEPEPNPEPETGTREIKIVDVFRVSLKIVSLARPSASYVIL